MAVGRGESPVDLVEDTAKKTGQRQRRARQGHGKEGWRRSSDDNCSRADGHDANVNIEAKLAERSLGGGMKESWMLPATAARMAAVGGTQRRRDHDQGTWALAPLRSRARSFG